MVKTVKTQNIASQYKKEEKKIPNLRFPGFDGAWMIGRLEEFCNRISDGIHATPVYEDSGEYFFVNGNNLVDGKIEIDDNTKRISREEYVKHKRDLGDRTILMSINGTIGNLACYSNEKVVLGKSACYINITKQVEKVFIYNTLQLRSIKYFFNSELTGTTIKNLSLKTIKNTNVYIPSLPEQKKIASFLSAVDQKIQQLTRKKELLELYKKGVMQKIFSPVGGQAPEIRFRDKNGNDFPDWEEKRLGEICEMTSSKRVYLSDYVDRGIPFYRGKEISELKKNQVPSDLLYITEERYKDFKLKYGAPVKGDILITAVGTLGNIFRIRNNDKFYFKDGNLIWLRNITENSEFLEFYIQYNINELIKTSIGSTQKALTIVELKKIKLFIPSLEEQQKITSFLASIDKKIESVKTNINKPQKFKKGLLQQMFV